jgi:hypothetical protein
MHSQLLPRIVSVTTLAAEEFVTCMNNPTAVTPIVGNNHTADIVMKLCIELKRKRFSNKILHNIPRNISHTLPNPEPNIIHVMSTPFCKSLVMNTHSQCLLFLPPTEPNHVSRSTMAFLPTSRVFFRDECVS